MTHPIWTVYAVQTGTPSTVGTIVPQGNATLYPLLNQEGTGSVTIHATDPLLSSIALDQYVNLTYNGNSDYGFLIEHIAQTDADGNEGAGQFITLSGPCNIGLIADGEQPDWMTPGKENIRHYGTLDITSGYGGAPISGGKIMYHLLTDLRDDVVNPSGTHLNEFLWNYPVNTNATKLLVWDFTDVLDSNGNTWTDAQDIDFRVGTGALDILKQIAALGYDFNCKWVAASHHFLLHAYISPFGNDLSGSITAEVGVNCTLATRTQDSTTLVNHLTAEFTDPNNPFVELDDTGSMTAHRKRMGYLSVANAASSATATVYGNKQLAISKDPTQDIKITLYDSLGASVLSGYDLGDTIAYVNNLGYSASLRITGIQLVFPQDRDYADVTLDIATIKPLVVRTALDVRKTSLTAPLSGSALMAPVQSVTFPIGKVETITKSDTQSGTGSYVDDTQLKFTAAPNATYSITLRLIFSDTILPVGYSLTMSGAGLFSWTATVSYSLSLTPDGTYLYSTEVIESGVAVAENGGGNIVVRWSLATTSVCDAGSTMTITRTA